MQYSTNYNLNLVEGTDIVNPLVIDKPNYQTIDGAMKANKDAAIDAASHTKAGTVHAIVRTDTDAKVFRFVASAPFVAGDTFTVDGTPVTGINTAGEGLETNDFVIGASVICTLNSSTLTLNINKKVSIPSTYDATDINFDNTGTDLTASNAQDAIEEVYDEFRKNTIGARIAIDAYNSISNLYTFPADGYVWLGVTNSGRYSMVYLIGSDEDTSNNHMPSTLINGTGNATRVSVFVRKGMKCYIESTDNVAQFYFPIQ